MNKENSLTKTTSDNHVIYNHYKDQLIKSVIELFTTYDIGLISRIFNDSVFFAANPRYALDLDKAQIVDILTDQLGLLTGISEMYTSFWDYYHESNNHNNIEGR